MWEVLRCPVGKEFYVTASFDDENKHGKLKTISLKLHRAGEAGNVLATKFFAWPEAKFPSEVTYDESTGVLLFKGTSNIARIPFSLSEAAIARFSVASSSKAALYASLSMDATDPLPVVVAPVLDIVNRKDLEKNWTLLHALCEDKESSLLPIGMFLSSTDQFKFLDAVLERTKRDKDSKILCLVLQRNILTSLGVDTKVAEFCANEGWFEPIFCLLQCVKVINEGTYAHCLKMAARRLKSGGKELLRELLKRAFTKERLAAYVAEIFSEEDVILLIDELVLLLKGNHTEQEFEATVSLMTVLLDSHAQRLIWDEKSGNSLTAATDLIADYMQSLDSFNNFNLRIEQRLKLHGKICDEPRRSDYSVREVKFKAKFI